MIVRAHFDESSAIILTVDFGVDIFVLKIRGALRQVDVMLNPRLTANVQLHGILSVQRVDDSLLLVANGWLRQSDSQYLFLVHLDFTGTFHISRWFAVLVTFHNRNLNILEVFLVNTTLNFHLLV